MEDYRIYQKCVELRDERKKIDGTPRKEMSRLSPNRVMKGEIISCAHKDIYFLETNTKSESTDLANLFASPAGREMVKYKPRTKLKHKLNPALEFKENTMFLTETKAPLDIKRRLMKRFVNALPRNEQCFEYLKQNVASSRNLKISWTEHVSSEGVCRRMKKDTELTTIKARKLEYLGHNKERKKIRSTTKHTA
ncbi:hypothetical protein Trydic_g19774 [Trypoxylus dichotomus]